MLIDTHSHLDFPDFEADRPEIIQRALEAGVTRLISIGTTLRTSRAALALADEAVLRPASVKPTMVYRV